MARGPEEIVVEHHGRRVVALDWGGSGPTLLLLHPNGFCAGVWEPLALAVRGDYRPVAIDAPGHGASDPPADPAGISFPSVAAAAAAVVDALELGPVLALGHSMGGACTVLLEAARPGTVTRALLCEAIAFPRLARPGGELPQGNVLAEGARRRRAVWPDRDAVRDSFASRPPLDVLAPEVLDAYIRWGFHDRDDGQVELACAPEVEAAYFDASATPDGALRAFGELAALRGRATVLCGARTNLPREFFAAQADALGSPLVELDGSHFLLQEDTARAADLVRRYL